ncbi:MAG: right-handed parallel beta-helix repeat-containing protein, partial [Candidatus Omnitrophota bacterium]
EAQPTIYNNNIIGNNSWGIYKGSQVLNDNEDIQFNNVWNNSSGTVYNTTNANGISSDPLFTVSASGTSTGLTVSTLTDTTKLWTANQWKGYILVPNTGNRRRAFIIVSNTSNTLTVGSYDAGYEITDFAAVGNSYEITDLTLQGGSPCINAGHTANMFSDTWGAYDRNNIGATGGYGPVPRVVPYNISACINGTGVQLDATYYQCHPDKTATFNWAQAGGTSVTLSNTASKTPTFTAPSTAQTLTFTTTVNDGYADSAAHVSYAYINPYVQINGAGSYTSINNAIDNATAGQTVNVPAGHFMEQVDLDGKAITLDGAEDFGSIIDGDDRISYGIYAHTNETNSTVVKDMQITRTYRDAVYASNSSPVIQKNYIHDSYRGIYSNGTSANPLVEENYIVKIIEENPILIASGGHGTFRKNRISGNRSYTYVYPNNASYTPVFENNIIAGNLSYGFYVRYADTRATFVNNVIYGNSSYGFRINVAAPTLTNNIVATNYANGIYCHDGGTAGNTYNDVWNNSSANYTGCSAGTGDISVDPKFTIEANGTITSITKTTLTDTTKNWAANQWRGYYLIPDTADKYCAFIWSNTANTLTVVHMRNIDWDANPGNAYQIISFKLQESSPCVDIATNTGAPTEDFWGDVRPYNNGYAYYDNVSDIGVDETLYSLPGKPTIGTPTALSTTSIRWNFTDTANNEAGFKLHDGAHAVKVSNGTPNLAYIDETGLASNTQYSRHVVSYNNTVIPNSPNAAGESDDSGAAVIYTLAANADAVCARATATWYQGDKAVERFNFTSANLNSGGIAYYRYKWDRAPATAVTGSDTQWTSGTLSIAPWSSKKMYLHVTPYNAGGIAGTQANYGPYYFVETSRLLKHKKFFDEDGTLINIQ